MENFEARLKQLWDSRGWIPADQSPPCTGGIQAAFGIGIHVEFQLPDALAFQLSVDGEVRVFCCLGKPRQALLQV